MTPESAIAELNNALDRWGEDVELQRVTGQHTRIELRCIESGVAELAREHSARLRDAVQLSIQHFGHDILSAASSSA